MAWFKVDDSLATHPKWVGLNKGARALWITAGSWCASQLTDGFVPAHALRLLDGTSTEARRLVEVGLWIEAEGGWVFHDWSTYQPSREQVLRDREREAARKAEWRAKRRERANAKS